MVLLVMGVWSVPVQQEVLDWLRQWQAGDVAQASLPHGPAHQHPALLGQATWPP